jgi:hypothetical protein
MAKKYEKPNYYFPNNKRELAAKARNIVLQYPDLYASLIRDAIEQYFYSQNKNMIEGWLEEQKHQLHSPPPELG